MTYQNTRRDLLKLAGATAAASVVATGKAFSQQAGRVVVIGGGFGGATVARYLRRAGVAVTLIDSNPNYITCPFSNYVLSGVNQLASVTKSFDGLKAAGVTLVTGTVTGINTTAKTVAVGGASAPIPYDRLVISPGIDFKFSAIQGYNEAATEKMPHAFKAGAQTTLLRNQLVAMPDGGTFVMAVPDNPFRCPPGPYERASQIAYYFKQAKPRSKIIIVDAKEAFSKQGLFTAAWAELYPGMIEWRPPSKGGGKTVSVDLAAMTVATEFDKVKGDVVNVIPPQRSGTVVDLAGLADGDWCAVDAKTFESKKVPGIHLVGDAILAGAMPKSGFSANNQGKIAAAAIVNMLANKPAESPSYINTCYSLVAPDYGISVANVYTVGADGNIAAVPNTGGVSPAGAPAAFRKQEADYARGWYASISADIWG